MTTPMSFVHLSRLTTSLSTSTILKSTEIGRGLKQIGDYESGSIIRLRSVPMECDDTSTTSPGFKNRAGDGIPSSIVADESAAVPAPVPPLRMSPG